MPNVPISALPAASSATGPDQVPLLQSATTKRATVTMLLNALSGVATTSSVALSDTIAAIQTSVAKQLTVQHLFDAGSGLASVGVGSGTNVVFGSVSGVAKSFLSDTAASSNTLVARDSGGTIRSVVLATDYIGVLTVIRAGT